MGSHGSLGNASWRVCRKVLHCVYPDTQHGGWKSNF